MSAFLYGCKVQSIGEFIFSSNVLNEIIGASELVKCTEQLADGGGKGGLVFTEQAKADFGFQSEPEIILAAAGKLCVVFENEADLAKIVREMPRHIAKKAYGLKIDQAVVAYDKNAPDAYQKASGELELRIKAQKNAQNHPLDFAFALLKQSQKTALPLFAHEKCDKGTLLKLRAFEEVKKREQNENAIYELAKISNDKNKIALIYADGNGLGRLIKYLNAQQLTKFSRELDKATKDAFKRACKQVKDELAENAGGKASENPRAKGSKTEFKIREIICGGDDLVVICNANIALSLTTAFLKYFEELSSGILGRCGCKNLGAKSSKEPLDSLTACAGIAYSNDKFPIHYALTLAKDLCKHAKNQSKAIDKDAPPSSLIFHNIQSSLVRSYDEIIAKELTLGAHLGVNPSKNGANLDENPSENGANSSQSAGVRCDFGAYFLNKQAQAVPLIADFMALVKAFREPKSPAGRLREWLNILESSPDVAQSDLERISEIYATFAKAHEKQFRALHSGLSLQNSQGLIVSKDGARKTPIYDILSLISITKNVFTDKAC